MGVARAPRPQAPRAPRTEVERQYSNTCRKYGCKAKVFCKPCADMKNRIGTPDLLIVFTHTISHKMLQCALTSTYCSKVISSGKELFNPHLRVDPADLPCLVDDIPRQ